MINLMTLLKLQKISEGQESLSQIRAQISQLRQNYTQSGKPYFELELADSTARASLKIWSDSPAFTFLEKSRAGEAIELSGKFYVNSYGLNVNQPSARKLTDKEKESLFVGSPEQQKKSDEDWKYLNSILENLTEPRLQAVCVLALKKYEKKWRRAAAARTYHHARRGGLLEHTAQMLRCAVALAPLYPEIFPPLLYAGVLFHDIGKLWENDYEENGFNAPPSRLGELMGHITIGIEVVGQLWRDAKEKDANLFKESEPPSELILEHLMHLIASHHGEMQFGAPVTPRTPEAWVLHHIDNIDAKIEMLRCTYAEKPEVVPGLFESRRPLIGLAARPLADSIKSSTKKIEKSFTLENENTV